MPTLIPTPASGARSEPQGMTHVDPVRVLPGSEKEAFLAGSGLNGPFVADLLSDMTAHERGGAALYRSVAGRTNNPVLKQRYTHFGNQTVEHVDVLETLVARLGGDPGYVSPAARATERAALNLVESTFLLAGSVDLMTQELVMLDAVLLAEAKDHANWAGLAQLAPEFPAGDIRTAVEEAVDRVVPEEDEHVGWAQDMRTKLISAQVKSGAMQTVAAKAEEAVARIQGLFA
ncbi:MAG TPA: ferritin-like domain-containing protein [Acidimicrobiales bacterium]|nr:ferritin-like domain-containing protein [Acidimicrobiales bacterium]